MHLRRGFSSEDLSFKNSSTDDRFQQLKRELTPPNDTKVNKLECKGIQWRVPPKLKATRIRRSKITSLRPGYTFCSRAVSAQYYANHPTPPIFLKRNLRNVLTRLKLIPHDKMILTCFDDQSPRLQQNVQGGKHWLDRIRKREQSKARESPDSDIQQPSLIDYTKLMKEQESRVFSDDWSDHHIRRSERIKHFLYVHQDGSETDEDSKSESETLSTNACSPTSTIIFRHQEALDEDTRMVDKEKTNNLLQYRDMEINSHYNQLCYANAKRRMRRRHWHVKKNDDTLTKHKTKHHVKVKVQVKVNVSLNVSNVVKKAIINSQENLGSGYFGMQRRSLRLISKVQ